MKKVKLNLESFSGKSISKKHSLNIQGGGDNTSNNGSGSSIGGGNVNVGGGSIGVKPKPTETDPR